MGIFSRGHLSIFSLKKAFSKMSLKGFYPIGLLYSKHIFISLTVGRGAGDYANLWEKGLWWLVFMRVFKLTPEFNTTFEVSLFL